MATNRKLRADLLKKLGCSQQALSQRVQRKKAQAPMSTEDATYLIAHEVGMKIDRYLTPQQLDRVRSLHAAARSHAEPGVAKLPRRQQTKARPIQFAGKFRIPNVLLPATKMTEAQRMADIYPMLYALENSMREVIKRAMAKKFGDGWWDKQLTSGKLKNIHRKASDRMRSETTRLAWHQTRGAHPIDYVDLPDLRDIILGKHEHFFPDILGADRDWFNHFMKELEPSRNVICHMNPLNNGNVADVKVKIERWATLMGNVPDYIRPAA